MKTTLLRFLVITLCMPVMLSAAKDNSGFAAAAPDAGTKVTKIVLDPGHGGKDPGTNFGKVLEKDIVLNIAKKLGALIEKNLPDVEVIYTRTTDVYIPLNERTNIANKAGADLFLSIHVNAIDGKPEANGTSTFVMGNDKSGANMNVAMKENDVVRYEPNFETTYEGYKPGSQESFIIFSLMQYAYQDQSMICAEIIQKYFGKELPLHNRGAYHGPFLVLWRTTMPSVLTEIGFMTNKKDREYVSTAKGQEAAARALFNAFSEYKSRVEGRSNMVQIKDQADASSVVSEVVAESKPVVSSEKVAEKASPELKEGHTVTSSGTGGRVRTTLPDISSYFEDDLKTTAGEKKEEVKQAGAGQSAQASSASGQAARQENKPVTQPKAPASQAGNTAAVNNNADKENAEKAQQVQVTHNIRFYVQVSSLNKPVDINSPVFKTYKGQVIERKAANNSYKYMVGGVSTYQEAAKLQEQVRRKFRDAFMVAFDGNEQLSVSEARSRIAGK